MKEFYSFLPPYSIHCLYAVLCLNLWLLMESWGAGGDAKDEMTLGRWPWKRVCGAPPPPCRSPQRFSFTCKALRSTECWVFLGSTTLLHRFLFQNFSDTFCFKVYFYRLLIDLMFFVLTFGTFVVERKRRWVLLLLPDNICLPTTEAVVANAYMHVQPHTLTTGLPCVSSFSVSRHFFPFWAKNLQSLSAQRWYFQSFSQHMSLL